MIIENKRTKKYGFTLMEVVYAMAIFSIVVLAFTNVAIQIRRLSESLIYENTAMTAAQGYMEQIKSMEYDVLVLCWEDNSLPIPTKSISSGPPGLAIEVDDPLFLNTVNEKELVLDVQTDEADMTVRQYMQYKITPTVNNLDEGDDPIQALEVNLNYQFFSPQKGEFKWYSGSVRFVKSYAPTF